MLDNPTKIKGLIEMPSSCGAHMQEAKSKELYLVNPETRVKVTHLARLGLKHLWINVFIFTDGH